MCLSLCNLCTVTCFVCNCGKNGSVVVVSYLFNHLIDRNLIDHYIYIFIFEALANKLNLGQENFINFALFEILEDGFGK